MSKPRAFHPVIAALEERMVMTSVLATAPAAIPAGGQSARVSVTLPATAFAVGKPSTVFGLIVQPDPGDGLEPRIVAAYGPDGRHLSVTGNRPYKAGVRGQALALVTVSQPGPITVVVAGQGGTAGAADVEVYLPGDANGDGRVTIADIPAFAAAYQTGYGGLAYNADADSNRNGFVSQDDGMLLERNLSPLTPRHGIDISLRLAPGDQAPPAGFSNSGGITLKSKVTVLGHTTPGSLVFSDNFQGTYKFSGSVLPTDSNGNFSYVTGTSAGDAQGLTNTEFLVFDPYGQQKFKAFPIVKLVR